MSSTKRVTKLFPQIDSGSMAGNITGSETDVRFLDYARIKADWSGSSPVGTLAIQVQQNEGGTWENLTFAGATTVAVSGSPGSHEFVFTSLPFAKMRPVYTCTSGTGTLDVIFIGKGV